MQKNIFTSLLSLQMMVVILKTCEVEPINHWSPWATWAVLYVPIGIAIIGALALKLKKSDEFKQ